jgi:uncharacterized protein YegL
MSDNNHKSLNMLSRKQVRRALRAWKQAAVLGQQSLARLAVVNGRHQTAGYTETTTGCGTAVRDVLQEALNRIKPDETESDNHKKQWRPYIILHRQYVQSDPPDVIADDLGIARSTYNHTQAAALDMLADILHEMDQNYIAGQYRRPKT